MAALKTYDPKEVSVIFQAPGFAPVDLTVGAAEGSFVAISRTTRKWTMQGGADGEQTRVKSNNDAGTVTCTLKQASATNDLLSLITNADDVDNSKVGAVLIKDGTGRTLHAAPQAFLDGHPDQEFATTESNRAWVLMIADINQFTGGNQEAS